MASNLRGASIAELLLAIGIMAIAVLSVLALSIGVTKTSQKSNDLIVGEMMVDRILDHVVERVRADQPAGSKTLFWSTASHLPWETDTVTSDRTTFEYVVNAQTVQDLAGNPLGNGSLTDNRLKKIDVTVTWWDSSQAERQGYGKLTTRGSRLVSETYTQ